MRLALWDKHLILPNRLNMVANILFAFLIVIGMLFLWEIAVTKYPEAFITNYDYTDNGAEREEEE